MISRRAFLGGATALAATVVTATPALAERVFNVATQRWEEVDLKRMQYQRKEPLAKFQRRSVFVSTKEAPGTIVVDSNSKYLYYITGKNQAIRYGIGVGREGFGWGGVVAIGDKKEWPTWTPPAEMRARERAEGRILPVSMKGGPDNPLGARAMYLYKGGRDTIYRIHGTNQPWTIGQNLSSGCFRMMNKDVEDLYSRASKGTKVVVVAPGQSVSQYLVEAHNPLMLLLGG